LNKRTDLWEKELWTQKEVAEYFRVSRNTIKNWRNQGHLSYYQTPGSYRVFYFRDEIKYLIDTNSVKRKGGERTKKQIGLKKEMPVKSPDRKWRVE
jgi:excisionase family DNA binding protein